MQLHRTERDYYVLEIEVLPEMVGTWEASFDGGETYVAGTPQGENWAWLVAGPDFDAVAVGLDPLDTGATLLTDVEPLVRCIEDPVVNVEDAPKIELWS
jgi:hypothetical protein